MATYSISLIKRELKKADLVHRWRDAGVYTRFINDDIPDSLIRFTMERLIKKQSSDIPTILFIHSHKRHAVLSVIFNITRLLVVYGGKPTSQAISLSKLVDFYKGIYGNDDADSVIQNRIMRPVVTSFYYVDGSLGTYFLKASLNFKMWWFSLMEHRLLSGSKIIIGMDSNFAEKGRYKFLFGEMLDGLFAKEELVFAETILGAK